MPNMAARPAQIPVIRLYIRVENRFRTTSYNGTPIISVLSADTKKPNPRYTKNTLRLLCGFFRSFIGNKDNTIFTKLNNLTG